jgi:hypothetical protein
MKQPIVSFCNFRNAPKSRNISIPLTQLTSLFLFISVSLKLSLVTDGCTSLQDKQFPVLHSGEMFSTEATVSVFSCLLQLPVTCALPLQLPTLRTFGRGRTYVMTFSTIFLPIHKTNINQVYKQLCL